MTPSDRDLLSDVNRRRSDARDAILRAIPDIPSTNGSGGGSGVSDRTGRLGCLVVEGVDQAYKDLRLLNKLEQANRTNDGLTSHQLRQYHDLCDRWAPTQKRRQALEQNLRAAANDDLNRHDDHRNCRSCARDPESFADPFRRGLCVNCYRRVDRINELYVEPVELPPVSLVVLLRERGKVTDRDIHNAMVGKKRREIRD